MAADTDIREALRHVVDPEIVASAIRQRVPDVTGVDITWSGSRRGIPT